MKILKGCFYCILSVFLFAACNNSDEGVNSEWPYFVDYKVWSEEGSEQVTCLAQIKPDSFSDATLLLQEPATIKLDGELLKADSASFSGAYYEIQKPVQQFSGAHTLTLTDEEGKKHKTPFTFYAFTLKNELPYQIQRGDIQIALTGLPAEAVLRVVVVDTSFTSADINEVTTVKNGTLTIPQSKLNNVKAGPITLQLYTEEEKPLLKKGAPSGHLSLSYGLKRDLELVN